MHWSRTFEKNLSAAFLLPFPVIAFLSADGVARLVGARLPGDPALLTAAPARVKVPPGPFHSASAGAILHRNPFDSLTGPLDVAPGSEPGDPLVFHDDPATAPPCDDVRVVAIASSSDPSWSIAALRTGPEAASMLRRRGGEVGGKTVVFVGFDRVWLGSRGSLCQSELFAPHPTVAPKVPATPLVGALPPSIASRIRRVGATQIAVDRGVVDEILESYGVLLRTTRFAAERENGKVVGLRISGVGPGTLFDALGVQNGDRLETLNGFELGDPRTGLEAYAKLRGAEHLTLRVNRAGREVSLDVDIR